MSKSWLEKLKIAQLHRLAVLTGAPCSGSKSVRIDQIQAAARDALKSAKVQRLSIVSIDMGIVNLAYCHLTSSEKWLQPGNPSSASLQSWKRFSITTPPLPDDPDASRITATKNPKASLLAKAATKPEPYDPDRFASYAHGFMTHLIDAYKPTHILIERQRFRSGGGSAVQEWTLKVGVLEAMFYAVMKTLTARGHAACELVPIPPPMVNRYWVGDIASLVSGEHKKPADRVKKLKIGLAGQMLETGILDETRLTVSHQAQETKDLYLSKWSGKRNVSHPRTIPKLDDLSDCLLQGLAWFNWQRNRARIASLGEDAFDLSD